jgi:GNAT superfamily N-acetyltransferase
VHALNNYIQTLASQHAKKRIGKTFVALNEENPAKILGFYTICAGSIAFDSLNPSLNLPKYPIPIARIARLAVDLASQKKRVGERLLMDGLYRTAHLAKELGMFGVIVDAKDEKARDFYFKYGFSELINKPLTLILPIKSIPIA